MSSPLIICTFPQILPPTLPTPSFPSPLVLQYSPFPSPHLPSSRISSLDVPSSPPPPNPPAWQWSCHICGSTFPIGATRRCLNDGHYFCSGTTRDRRSKRMRTHRSCGSVFDYAGWQAWGEWRRKQVVANLASHRGNRRSGSPESKNSAEKSRRDSPTRKTAEAERNCDLNCSFPSECRWRPKLEADKAAVEGILGVQSAYQTRKRGQRSEMQVLDEEDEQPGEASAPLIIHKLLESPATSLPAAPSPELETTDEKTEEVSPQSPSDSLLGSPVSPLTPDPATSVSPTRSTSLFSKIITSAERRAAGFSATIAETLAAGGLTSFPSISSAAPVQPRVSSFVEHIDTSSDTVMGGAEVVSPLKENAVPMELDAGAAEAALKCGKESMAEWDWSVGGCRGERLGVGMGGEAMDLS